jgi:hypothetical protein
MDCLHLAQDARPLPGPLPSVEVAQKKWNEMLQLLASNDVSTYFVLIHRFFTTIPRGRFATEAHHPRGPSLSVEQMQDANRRHYNVPCSTV